MFDGRMYRRSLKTRKKDDAVKYEAAFRTSLVKGEFGITEARNSPTLPDFETRLLAHLKSSVAVRTYEYYAFNVRVLKGYEPFHSCRIDQIDAQMIEAFIQHKLQPGVRGKVLTPVAVNHALRTLRRVLHVAFEWKLIRAVPKVRLLPNENRREYVLTKDDVSKMVKHIRAEYRDGNVMEHLLPFLVDTGLRISEATALTGADCTDTHVEVRKGKTKNARRSVPLTPRAAKCLKAALSVSKCGMAFTTNDGHAGIKSNWPSHIFKAARIGAGISNEAVLHSTRHTFASNLGASGADAFTIMRLCGHGSVSVSQRYTHPTAASEARAVRAMARL
jgi:integrase